MPITTQIERLLRSGAALMLSSVLAACGGGNENAGDMAPTVTARSGTEGVAFEEAASAPPAWINAQSLENAETQAKATSAESAPLEKLAPGRIAAWDNYANGNVARKSAAARIPVYRFYNTQTTAHFYTTSETEKANILASAPHMQLDGTAFHGASAFSPGLSPVYRFYNSQSGVHFYTISETEKANILATLPHFVLEGPAYHASQVSGKGLTPLYRFHIPAKGFHFYTASAAERDSIIANLASTYSYEGIAYYVLASSWTAEKLPHTGLGVTQCYARNPFTGDPFFGSCESAISVTNQQDSKRRAVNPMQYYNVFYFSGLFLSAYPTTSCMSDGVTGLIWEGKTDDGGLRDKDNNYTRLGNGLSGDTSGYLAAVNASALCGYTDWRLPTALEWSTLLNYGMTASPSVDSTAFPNMRLAMHWTADLQASNTNNAWAMSSQASSGAGIYPRTSSLPVRLVRGSMSAGSSRFTFTTVPFTSPGQSPDASNNVVNDAMSGLQWRRCYYGERWTGTACTGPLFIYTHQNALSTPDGLGGWRLPNAKEARSLMDLSHAPPYLDPVAFPSPGDSTFWTSTADVADPMAQAYMAGTSSGSVNAVARNSMIGLMLVRVP